jgi:hypothetical protein
MTGRRKGDINELLYIPAMRCPWTKFFKVSSAVEKSSSIIVESRHKRLELIRTRAV